LSQDQLAEFLESAQKSGLLSAADAGTLSRELRENGAATRDDAVAKLVDKKLLTPFQAEQLLAGHGEECVLAGRYFIRQKLGAGAMGAVYLADDKKLDRAVAIKVLPAQSVTDAGAVARFQREAKALAKLSHPNIIQAYDSDEDAGRQFLVMEYAEGTNLGEVIRARGRIPPALAADYVYQAALGLQNAHEKGLVHRDLKPGNLLLTPHGQLKILDLGLARFLQDQVGDATLTREGTGMGTPDYMPPEQFHDARHVDARSDIYSLGCTLYHLITGRVPFPGTSMSAKYAAHEQHEPPPLEEFCPDVPAGLALVVQRMMAKRPADRFQSAREVAEAVFPHVAGSSHAILHIKGTVSWHGSQLGLSVEPLRVRRRRRLLAGSGATAAVLALVMLAFWTGGAFRRAPREESGGRKPSDPNVLTVAQDGSGDFQTIGEALKQVTAGRTIRVLDVATYSESLSIDDADLHARVVLEATQGATIEMPAGSNNALSIYGVGEVTVRGFRFRDKAARPNSAFIHVSGQSPGVVLERLDIQSSSNVNGILLLQVAISETHRPLVITECAVRVGGIAISAYGTEKGPCRRILIRDNRVWGSIMGVRIDGTVSATAVTGNLLWECGFAGIQLQDLALDSDVLVANNTVYKTQSGLRLWLNSATDTLAPGKVTVINNLLFGCSGGDMLFSIGAKGKNEPTGAGDGTSLIDTWRFANNFRDLLGGADPEYIVPLAANDRKLEQVDVVSRDSSDHDFLRPVKDSPLATEGAGGDLPGYVGAVLPQGLEPWDWQKTFDSRHPAGIQNQLTGGDIRKPETRSSGPPGAKREPPKPVEFPQQATLVETGDWQILADASRDEMQTWLDARKESNHSVMWLDSVQIGEEPVFIAVAALDDRATGWQAFLDLTDAEINDFNQLRNRLNVFEYLLTSLSGYTQKNELKSTALFQPGKRLGGAIGVRKMDVALANLDQQTQQGSVARLLRPFPVGGDVIFCGLSFETLLGRQSKYGLNLAEVELLERLEENRKDGYLPISVVAYPTQGELRFATTFRENTTKAVWEVHRNLTAADLNAKAAALAEKRFTPASVTACPWDGAVRYCGVWVKEPPRPVEFPKEATYINQPGWETIVDASKDEMEKWLAERKAAKHSVVWLDSVLVGDKPLFAAVAALDDRRVAWPQLWMAMPEWVTRSCSRKAESMAPTFVARRRVAWPQLWVAMPEWVTRSCSRKAESMAPTFVARRQTRKEDSISQTTVEERVSALERTVAELVQSRRPVGGWHGLSFGWPCLNG